MLYIPSLIANACYAFIAYVLYISPAPAFISIFKIAPIKNIVILMV